MKQLAWSFCLVLLALPSAEAQLIKTTLNLTVRDELGNIVEGATVALYETEANYTEEKNPVATGTTNAKGLVKFKELKAIPYYVIVRKGDLDNSGAGEQIGKLEANKFNSATIIIR
jgi:hypothetical protein